MLERRKENPTVYLEVKYHSLWQALKTQVEGCDVETPTNPKTGEKVAKYGFKFERITGFARKLEWYDTKQQYDQRYFGFKMTIEDAQGNTAVLDLPYDSQVFKRFARCANNFNWTKPFTLSVWKSYNRERKADETAFNFTQDDVKIPVYFSKDNPNGMPAPEQDEITGKYDYSKVNRFLALNVRDHVTKEIEKAVESQPVKAVTAAAGAYAGYVNSDVDPNANTVSREQARQALEPPMDWNEEDDSVPF